MCGSAGGFDGGSTSLKRNAMHTALRVQEDKKRRVIAWVPDSFTRIPQLMEDGFPGSAISCLWKETEYPKVLPRTAQLLRGMPRGSCLRFAADTRNHLQIIVSHAVRGEKWERVWSRWRKNPAQFLANLATRMLWLLRQKALPWEADDGMVLQVSEMTNKIERKEVNNRFLREIGWTQVHGSCSNPRNSDLGLRRVEELLNLRKELLSPLSSVSSSTLWIEKASLV